MHETELLRDYFHFHPLAIEDCFQHMQRKSTIMTATVLCAPRLEPGHTGNGRGRHFSVRPFHRQLPFARIARRLKGERTVFASPGLAKKYGHITYMIMDQLVDEYFPVLYKIEDRLNEIEDSRTHKSYGTLMNEVFELRTDLLNLRRTIIPMRDLMYRILSLDHVKAVKRRRISAIFMTTC